MVKYQGLGAGTAKCSPHYSFVREEPSQDCRSAGVDHRCCLCVLSPGRHEAPPTRGGATGGYVTLSCTLRSGGRAHLCTANSHGLNPAA
jgi:hypothetical protein